MIKEFNIYPQDTYNYTKTLRSNGNTEYTIKYKTIFISPCFTKILVNPENEILAYIDVQRIPDPFESQFKKCRHWFGIQEFHPELIGDFKYVISDKKGELFFGNFWEHKTAEHLYIFNSSGLGTYQDWYHVKTNPWLEETIETNFGILDGSTRSYRYYTHPSVPTDRIENLKKEILIKEGIIKPQSNFVQEIKTFFQKRK